MYVYVHLLVQVINNSPYSATIYGPGVDSTSNGKRYEEYFLGVKAAGA
jgi:hypothetical protein